MGFLDWLNDVAEWFAQFVPEWELLLVTHGGVKFKRKGRVIVLTPGELYWIWPVMGTQVVTIPVKRQTLSFNQRLTSKDGLAFSVSIVIVFVVDDVEKALVDTWDFEDTIIEVAQKVTIQPLMSREFYAACENIAQSNEMRNELARKARSLLSPYGVNVLDAYVRDFTQTKVLTHEGSGLAVDYEEDDE